MSALVLAMTTIQLVAVMAIYVWGSLALSALFAKTDTAPWRAWVPVLNWWTLFELAGMRGWWAAVLTGAGAVVGALVAVIGAALSTAALEASFGGDATAAGSAMLAAATLPSLLWLVWIVPAVVLQVRMLAGVGRGFGVGVGYTVLGLLLPPVWASVLGWGSARWGAAAAPAAEPVAIVVPAAPPLASFGPGPSPVARTLPPVFGAVPPPAPAPASPAPLPTLAPAAPAPAPSAPGRHTSAVPAPAPAPTPAPVSAAAATPAPAPIAPAASAAPPSWTLQLPDGRVVPLRSDVVVLGRNPVAPAGSARAQLVSIDDVTRTVSKTHAVLTATGAGWTIADLESTNGVALTDAPDVALSGATPVADPVSGAPRGFLLGDAALALRREDGGLR